jgi:hypothetical protein
VSDSGCGGKAPHFGGKVASIMIRLPDDLMTLVPMSVMPQMRMSYTFSTVVM